jgi:anti-sigma B factor antagonist
VSEIRYPCKMIGGVPVLEAPAEIDITTADELRAVLLATAALGYVTVVVDRTVTRCCDCCGLHALLRAHRLAQADGGELRLVIPADGLVPRILPLTCLDRSIPCFASLKEAVAQTPAAANGRRDARGPAPHADRDLTQAVRRPASSQPSAAASATTRARHPCPAPSHQGRYPIRLGRRQRSACPRWRSPSTLTSPQVPAAQPEGRRARLRGFRLLCRGSACACRISLL